ncbi:MAG: hypothetical protein K9K82_12150 [Desulfobacteraceae bacterium]|nr:hypothetical protein [Desulfobacteraceae bacterium]
METYSIAFFSPYPFEVGQKIHISSGPRVGDWEVIGVTDRKVKLKCPVSFREFEWDRFCYFTGDRLLDQWPQED